jgi:hypothetical protein
MPRFTRGVGGGINGGGIAIDGPLFTPSARTPERVAPVFVIATQFSAGFSRNEGAEVI